MLDGLLGDLPASDAAKVMSADKLASIRQQLGLSARKMAELVGVEDGRTVRRWEAGDRSVPGPVAVLLHAIVQHRGVRGAGLLLGYLQVAQRR